MIIPIAQQNELSLSLVANRPSQPDQHSQRNGTRHRERWRKRVCSLFCSALMLVFMLLMLVGLLWDFFFGPQQLSLVIGFLACVAILILMIGVRRNLRNALQSAETTTPSGADDIENAASHRQTVPVDAAASRRRLFAQVLASSSAERLSMQQLRLSLIERDFTADDYDALLALDREIQDEQHLAQGASQSDIDRLPTITIPSSAGTHIDDSEQQPLLLDSRWSSLLRKNCAICLESYQPGDTIRTLPCLHQFHCHCVDRWLCLKASCPMGCKVELFAESPR